MAAMKTFSKKVLTSAVQIEAELQDISAKHGLSPWTHKITPFDDKFSIFQMEAVNGKSIYEEYGDDPADVPLGVWNQIRFILQTLWDEEGIEYVDITSYNFMIDEDEKVWVIDFGDASYSETGKRNWFHEEFLDGTNSWNPDFK
jgi:RIO-like serine/threonine protein kinase